MDFADPPRVIRAGLVAGRGHYDTVIRAVMEASRSIWIATANLKELMVEDHRAAPGRARTRRRRSYRSVLAVFDEQARRGVEIRILHAGPPSRAFRDELDRHPTLFGGGLELRTCPRLHFKAVVVDGGFLYLGSANWTGAGLGAKGAGRRNFELGFVIADNELLDRVQFLYERIWTGGECGACKMRDLCPGPLDLAGSRSPGAAAVAVARVSPPRSRAGLSRG
jgi:phosphatidylserine/phosphatidylglycerophosphate/cardiolipin synthase-like enzyme